MDKRSEVDKLLREHKAVLVRKRKHEIWRFPDGKTFVRATSASDQRSDANNLSDLRLLLGIEREFKDGERRTKRTKTGRTESIHYNRSPNTGLADQLISSGVAVSVLQDKIDALTRQNEQLLQADEGCWMCRIMDWIGRRF